MILLTAIMLYVCVIKASSHIINFVSLIILYLILQQNPILVGILIMMRSQQQILILLELKVRALVMLLRNIDVHSGLCNGTTMKVISITTKILKLLELQATFVVDHHRILQFYHQKSYHY